MPYGQHAGPAGRLQDDLEGSAVGGSEEEKVGHEVAGG